MTRNGMRIRVPASGRTVGVTFARTTLEALIDQLPEGAIRIELEQGLAEAVTNGATAARETRLDARLSIESLSMVGWMMTGDHSRVAHGAIREGDFRFVETTGRRADSGWECGPPGAFDREPDGVRVLRGAAQAAVFSEVHCAYRMLAPTTDRAAAIAAAIALEIKWRAALPPKPIRPAAVPNPGIRSDQWPMFRRECDLAAYPEGAFLYGMARPTADTALGQGNVEDEKVAENDQGFHVSIYPCEAVLRPLRTFDPALNACRTSGMRWCVGTREAPRFGSDRRVLDGPYDLVAGSVWAAYSNAAPTPSWHVGGQINMPDPGPREAIALTSRDEALKAAMGIAMRYEVTEADADAKAMTIEAETVPVPDIEMNVPLAA